MYNDSLFKAFAHCLEALPKTDMPIAEYLEVLSRVSHAIRQRGGAHTGRHRRAPDDRHRPRAL